MVGGPSEVYASSGAAVFCAGMNPLSLKDLLKGCLLVAFFENLPVLLLLIKLVALGIVQANLTLLSFAQPFPSGDKGCANRPFNSLYEPFGSPCRGQKRNSNRFAIRLADHQRSSPAAELRIFVRDKPQGHTMLDACSMLMEPQGHTNRCLMLIARNLLGLLLMGTQGPMLDAVMIILFIRLWTGSTLERFPSGLWRKSCDHHWHLMNDHNDRDYHL